MSNQLSTTFQVGNRYRCTIVLPLSLGGFAQLATKWEPAPPTRLTKSELQDYRRGRDALLAEAARVLGGAVLVAEV
jgi:hypothetical protein